MAERIRSILPGVLKQAAENRRPLVNIQRGWPNLVGKEMARHTRPVSLRRGRLVVQADQPGDNFALSYQRSKVLSQLKVRTKGQVTELIIRAGEG